MFIKSGLLQEEDKYQQSHENIRLACHMSFEKYLVRLRQWPQDQSRSLESWLPTLVYMNLALHLGSYEVNIIFLNFRAENTTSKRSISG